MISCFIENPSVSFCKSYFTKVLNFAFLLNMIYKKSPVRFQTRLFCVNEFRLWFHDQSFCFVAFRFQKVNTGFQVPDRNHLTGNNL